MTEDWAAVAKAINERVNELGIKQRVLAERSGVSQAIIRELQYNTVERRRGSRTLEALAVALGWHPQHLTAVLNRRKPPAPGDPIEYVDDPVANRLSAIEERLDEIAERLDTISSNLTTVIDRAEQNRQQ
ncbi:XRE family transcriptional regulator [Kibdelosporangium philippinense]|uniref:XRE family transcriptional regulator n=1 Tax=Kibdelosporangium philippinense TaxID=211113 RepID=A0ABS8ZW76_9PSEU|nr:XRE family transcriptional regulator [Kibdelosporangium philippinense]MCE7011829.1 XRE family transcriptional regulator [Kibdelosporangium philippinense]